jgi:hypothetical protein
MLSTRVVLGLLDGLFFSNPPSVLSMHKSLLIQCNIAYLYKTCGLLNVCRRFVKKKQPADFTETSVYFYHTTRRHIPKYRPLWEPQYIMICCIIYIVYLVTVFVTNDQCARQSIYTSMMYIKDHYMFRQQVVIFRVFITKEYKNITSSYNCKNIKILKMFNILIF